MNNQQAIEVLSDFNKQVSAKADGAYQSTIGKMACDLAITALEKQIPKKPEKVKDSVIRYTEGYICPSCGGAFTATGIAAYCYHCGQAIDWNN